MPPLAVGDAVAVASLEPQGHATSPPARYTEASLVKRLEELGIGRPSTWASIIQTVQDRGYVWKKGQALVPTWTAFVVTNLLERNFTQLVDYAFTAHMEDELDDIENHKIAWRDVLSLMPMMTTPLPGTRTSPPSMVAIPHTRSGSPHQTVLPVYSGWNP